MPETVPIALARQAKQLARERRLESARETLARARLALPVAPRPTVTVEMALAQATLMYYGDEPEPSIAVLLQARAEARAAGLTVLEAECAATAALHLLQFDRHIEAVEQAGDALRLSSAEDHAVRYRASLALGNVCHYEGLSDLAFPYYRVALAEARAMGDELATRATINRMGNAQAHEAMRAHLLGTLNAEALTQAIVGVRAGLLWGPVLNASHDALDQLLLAMLLRLRGEFAAADALFARWRPHIDRPSNPGLPADAAAEQGLCRLALGDRAGATVLCGLARSELLPKDDCATQARTLRNIAALLRAAGDAIEADAHDARAERALVEHERRRSANRDAIAGALRPPRGT